MPKPNIHTLHTNLGRRTRRTLAALALTAALITLIATSAHARPYPGAQPTSDAILASTIVRVTTSSGFDWGDAAIGAAAGLAISLVVIGATLALYDRREHHPPTTSSPFA